MSNNTSTTRELGLSSYQRMMSNLAYLVTPLAIGSFEIDTVIELIDDTAQRLRLLDSNGPITLFGFFKNDMVGIEHLLSNALTHCRAKAPDRQNDLIHAVADFNETSSKLWAIHIRALSAHDNNFFNITPVLAHLNESGPQRPTAVEDLFSIPDFTIPDVLSTIQQHCHIFQLNYSHSSHVWTVRILQLGDELYSIDSTQSIESTAFNEDKGWRTRGEWKHQRSLLVYRYLRMFFLNGYNYQKKSYEYACQLVKLLVHC